MIKILLTILDIYLRLNSRAKDSDHFTNYIKDNHNEMFDE